MGLYLPTGEKINSNQKGIGNYENADFMMRGSRVELGSECVITMTPLLEFNIQGFKINAGYFVSIPSCDRPSLTIVVNREIDQGKDHCPIVIENVNLDCPDSVYFGKDGIERNIQNISFVQQFPLLLSTDKIILESNVELTYFEFYGIFKPVVHTIDVF